MEITVKIKDQYGRQVVHPVCKKAKLLAGIAGTVTLTRESLEAIKQLGYQITVELPDYANSLPRGL